MAAKRLYFEHDREEQSKGDNRRLKMDECRWNSDNFKEKELGPESRELLISMYGYDIRKRDAAVQMRGRRPMRGSSPNCQSWYGGAKAWHSGGRGRPSVPLSERGLPNPPMNMPSGPTELGPESRELLIIQYGYDIRNRDRAVHMRGRRPMRGSSPSVVDSSLEDVDSTQHQSESYSPTRPANPSNKQAFVEESVGRKPPAEDVALPAGEGSMTELEPACCNPSSKQASVEESVTARGGKPPVEEVALPAGEGSMTELERVIAQFNLFHQSLVSESGLQNTAINMPRGPPELSGTEEMVVAASQEEVDSSQRQGTVPDPAPHLGVMQKCGRCALQ